MAEYIHEVSPEMEKLFSYRNGFQTKIIRCKDCEYFHNCEFFSYVTPDPNGFCAWAVKRDER